jgi:hypothetical protein
MQAQAPRSAPRGLMAPQLVTLQATNPDAGACTGLHGLTAWWRKGANGAWSPLRMTNLVCSLSIAHRHRCGYRRHWLTSRTVIINGWFLNLHATSTAPFRCTYVGISVQPSKHTSAQVACSATCLASSNSLPSHLLVLEMPLL